MKSSKMVIIMCTYFQCFVNRNTESYIILLKILENCNSYFQSRLGVVTIFNWRRYKRPGRNRRETRDKRQLDRESDRSWCHLHTSVKLFWSQSMAPWTSAAAWTMTKKALHQRDGDSTSCLIPYPRAACPEFYVGQAENLPPCYSMRPAHLPPCYSMRPAHLPPCYSMRPAHLHIR